MIIEFYKNPTKKKFDFFPKSPPPSSSVIALPATSTTPATQPEKPGGPHSAYIIAQAAHKGISPEEWIRRDEIVRKAVLAITYRKGDLMYPCTYERFQQYGMCRIIGICESYKDINDKEWPKTDAPFVILAMPMKHGEGTINATVGFFQKWQPTS